jgi:hypothetical protein
MRAYNSRYKSDIILIRAICIEIVDGIGVGINGLCKVIL